MAQPLTIRATIGAYLRSGTNPAELLDAIRSGDRNEQILGSVVVYSFHDMSGIWTRVGDADIEVTLQGSHDELVRASVASLNKQLEEARAEFMAAQQKILDQISKLQAIEYVAEA